MELRKILYRLLIHVCEPTYGSQQILENVLEEIHKVVGEPSFEEKQLYTSILVYDVADEDDLNRIVNEFRKPGRHADITVLISSMERGEIINAYLIFDSVHKLSSIALRQLLKMHPLLDRYIKRMKLM